MRINVSKIMVVSNYNVDLITNQLDLEGKKYIVLEESPEIYKIVILNDNFVRKDNSNDLKNLILKYIGDPMINHHMTNPIIDIDDVRLIINSAYGMDNNTETLITSIDRLMNLLLSITNDYEKKLLDICRRNVIDALDIGVATRQVAPIGTSWVHDFIDGIIKPTE